MSKKYQKKFLQALYYEELEPRLLFSADVHGALMPEPLSEENNLDYSVIEADMDPAQPSFHVAAAEQKTNQRHELVFVDSHTPDYQSLIDGILQDNDGSSTPEIVILDSEMDGIDQISETLGNYKDLDAVHFVSHGEDGAVQLGNTWLNLDNIETYEDAIAGWQQSFTDETDLLFYGCDFAEGKDGRALINTLSSLTGADVASSIDRTGAADLGGDWDLEYRIGDIENTVVFSAKFQYKYEGVLATPTVVEPISDLQSLSLVTENSIIQTEAGDLLHFSSAGGTVVGFDDDTIYVASLNALYQVELVNGNELDVAPVAEDTDGSGDDDLLDRVTFADAWDDITVVYEGSSDAILKSTYYIAPGADQNAVDQIHLLYNRQIELDEQGNLVMSYETGLMTESAPIAWQDIDGERVAVEVSYRLIADQEVGFMVGDYDYNYSLIIDPTLTWTTFLGSPGGYADSGKAIATDASGNVYVTGVLSYDWGDPLRAYSGGDDAFVAKFANNGSLVWSTFLGAAGDDAGNGISVDGSGNIYVTGTSYATWGTPVRGYWSSIDTFVAKLASDGSLTWNTFLGASGADYGYGVSVDAAGNIFVAGNTNFTWGSPVQSHSGNNDAYVAKLASDGSLAWNTFMGGAGSDYYGGVSLDASGDVYVAGYSSATWGTAPVQAYTGSNDGFVAKIAGSDGSLTWNTFIGDVGSDSAKGVSVDASGNIYVTGSSTATWGAPVRAYTGGINDAFVAKLASDGSLVWNTFVGAGGGDGANGIKVDASGDLFVIGTSTSSWGTPLQAFSVANEAYVAKLANDGSLTWHTFIGGALGESGADLNIDTIGNIYVTGFGGGTWGTPILPHAGGGNDAFIAKLKSDGSLTWNTYVGVSGDDEGYSIAVDGSGNVYVTGKSSSSWGASPIRAYSGAYDAYVAKLSIDGSLIWNTFLGGSDYDYGYGLVLDAVGNIYVSGYGGSTWGAPVRAFTGSNEDVFVAKLDNDGTLVWNTFLGGFGYEQSASAGGISVDASGNIYVTGASSSSWGTPVRAYSGSYDIFAAKLASDGSLTWNTFLGDTTYDSTYSGIDVDGVGNVYVIGSSSATWGAPIQAYTSGSDAFLVKLASNGALTWNTFLGGTGSDLGTDLSVDNAGNAYVIGSSNATWGTPVRAHTSNYDAFAAKIATDGSNTWNTFLGGTDSDSGKGISVDTSGNIAVTGYSPSTWGAPVRPYTSGNDALVARLAGDGSLTWNTFLGGAGDDQGNSIALDSAGYAYVSGSSTASWGSGPLAYSGGADGDAFVAKVSTPFNVYYSVGQNTSDHKTGTPDVTISNGVATFTVAQTATNMGVGDRVTYNGGSIAYISGKISNTEWSLVTATGLTSTDELTPVTVDSIAHEYASLSAAEAGAGDVNHLNTSDLVTGDYILNLPCYYDTGADTTAVVIDGWSTGAGNYINIYTPDNTSTEVNQSQRHSGVWNTASAYRMELGNDTAIEINLNNSNRFVRVDGLQIYITSSNAGDQSAVYATNSSATGDMDIRVSNNILRGHVSLEAWHAGFNTDPSPNLTGAAYLYNNIIYGFDGTNNNMGIVGSSVNADLTYYVYNNTIYDSYFGIYNNSSIVAKNNIVAGSGNTNAYFGTFLSGTDYNATDGTDTIGAGTHNLTSQTFSFVTPGSDFHLLSTDTGALNHGADLSADADLTFLTDIDGNSRPYNDIWDIGADEVAINVVSGTVFTDEGVTNIGAGKTVRLLVNGTSAGTAVTNDFGQYCINATVSVGDAVLVYVDENDGTANDGTTVSVVGGTSLSGFNIYKDHLITRHDNSGSLTNVLMDTALGAYSDTEIVYSISGGDLIYDTVDTELYVPTGYIFAPGGNIDVDSVEILGTFTGGIGETYNIAANWNAATGTYDHNQSHVSIFSRSGGFALTTGASEYYDVTFETNETSFTLIGNLNAANTVTFQSTTGVGFGVLNLSTQTITAKNFIWPSGYFIHGPGAGITVSENFTATGGGFFSGNGDGLTITFNGNSNSVFTPGTNILGSVVVNKTSQANTVTVATNSLTMFDGNSLDITSGILDLAGNDLDIGAGSTFSNTGTLQLQGSEAITNLANDVDSGTAMYNGNGSYASLAVGDAYFNLEFDNAAGTWALDAPLDVNSHLAITNGSLDVSAGNHQINVAGNWSNADTFTAGTGTVVFDGGDQAINGSTTFKNLTKVESTDNSTDVVLTFDNTGTQTVTGTLILGGLDNDDRINLVSDNPGNKWNINLTATATKDTLDYLDVTDSDASGSDASHKPISPTNSINNGNSCIDWFETTPPAAPVISSISTDSGAADGTTSDTTLVITGTAEADSSVEIFLDAGSIGTASTDGSGDWSFDYTGTTLAEGTYSLTAQATDLAANTGVLSSAFSVTVDTTNPAAPVITSISTDSGTADGTTNDTTLVIIGTAEANSSVEIFLDAGSIGTTTTDGSGDWSFDYTGTTLAEGTYAITAQATDLAANTGVLSGAFSVTIDTTNPAAPVITSISSDSGAADGTTNDATLVITGTAEANSSVEVFLDAGSIGTASTDGSGDWSFDYTGTTLAEGTYALTAQASDLAANTGVLSGAFSVTVDTTNPAAPVITSISTDSGAADGTTNDTTLVITGTAEADSSVEIFLDAGSIGTATTDGSGDWSFDYTGTTLAEGTYALTAQASDLAANTGVLSGAFSVTIDTTNPAAPVITSISTDSGVADGTTNDATLIITGTAEANSSVEIFLDAGSIGTASTDGSGDWSFDYTGTTLAEGTYALTAQANDLAANTGVLSGAFSVTIDTTNPAAPVITSISTDTGAADGTTSDTTLVITGTAEANSSVEIFLDAGSIGITNTDGSGDWSFDYTGSTLAAGTYALTAQATDLAANTSVLSGSFSVTIDTTAPAAPVITAISTDSGIADGTTNDATLVIIGTAEANSSLEIFLDAGSIGTATTDGSGDWSFDYTGTTLAEGTYALTAQATDLATNTGVLSGAFSVTIDTTNPAAPVITSISSDTGAADGTTSDTTLVINGTAEANSSVEIFLDAGSIGTTSTDGSGDWSFDYTGTTLAEGTYALTAQATDLAVNTGVLSGAFSVTVDTTNPAAPVITSISTDTGAADGTTSDTTLVITGTAEADSSVEIFLDAGSIGTTSTDGSGDWSFDYTSTTLAEGTYAFTAQATDLAANSGVLSGAFSVTIDTTNPAAPVITSISTDSGAADGTTNDTTLVITGTAEANSSVEIFLDAGSIGTASTDGSGDWSFDYTGTTLAEGTYALTAQANDLAANTGVLSGAFSVTIDTTNPAAPVITSISTDTGAADGTTSDTTLVITGTAEADSSVEIFLDAGSIGTASTDGSGDWSFDYTGTTLAEGTYALTAQATDLAANTGILSGAFSVTIDTTAPAAPVISSISTDSGAADGTTNDATLIITGTAEANSSVEIFLDAGSIGNTSTDGSGDWSFDYTGTTLAEGTYALTAQATDLAANAGVLSGAFSVTVDTTNPAAPVISSISTDSGLADGTTSDTSLVITGTAEANSSVEIFLDAGLIGTATTDGSGDWSFDYTGTTLAEGTYALTAQATDLAANSGVLSGAFSVTIDTTAPAAPVITSISTDSGAADGTTSDATLIITGTAEANSSVEIFLDAGSIGTASTDGSGDWSFDYTGTTLAAGTYALTAQATDLAANTGVLSGAFSVTVDTTAPAAPVISSISTDSGAADGTTNDTTLVIIGTAEANSSVEIFLDAGSIGITNTDGSGDWSFDYTGSTLAAGTYALTAQATDLAANTSVLSGSFSVTIDTTAPAAPVITAISTDSGIADGTTNDATLVIIGTAEANSSVEIFLDAGSIGTASTDGSGDWSFDYTGTTLAEGTYALTAQATDLAANTGVLSGAFSITVDTTAPAAPVISSISTDSGAADGTTNDATLVITGTAEANSSVEVFLDAGSIGTASTDGSGDWSFDYTGTTLAEGTYALTAQASDLAANTGVLSGAFSVTVDTTNPAAPVITSISTDSGAADGTTNDTTLVITGTAEADSSVEIFLDAGSIGTATTDGSGDWSFDYTGTTLAEGTYALTAQASDLAANTGVLSGAFSVTIDTTNPAAPVITSISTDSGVADGTTNDATLIITGTAEANSSVEIFLDAGSIGTASTDGSGDWSFDYTGTTLAEGTYALTAQATDLATNTGVLSGAFSVTIDTTAPAAPVISSISTDSGAADGTTSDTTLVITGTAEANSSVEIFLDAGSIGTATTDGSGDWSFDYTGTTLAAGTYALTAQATDLAANTGVLSGAFSVTVDTTAPAAPVITSISTDSGVADGITNDATLVITGTAEANSSVEIFVDASSIGTASTDGSGDWSFDYTGTALAAGTYALTAQVTDLAANTGVLSGAFSVTVDTTAPAAPVISSISTDSGAADGTTNDTTLVITGTAEANSSVEIFLDAGSIGITNTDGSGDWSFDYTGSTLAAGTYALTAQATDLAANTSVLSGSFSVTIDTTAPAAPVITAISTDSGIADGTTNDATLVIIGTAEANSSLEIFLDAGSIGTATTDGSGDWSFDYTGTTLAEGTYALTAQATDLATNTGVLSGAFSVTIDTTNPAAPVITSISSDTGAADGTTSDTTLVINGTAEADSSVEIFLDAGSIGTASTDGSGDWSFDYTGTTLAEGTYALTAQATDLAANTGVLSGAFSVTIDTTNPGAPVISSISTDSGAADGATNDTTLVITGTAEADSSVEIFLDAGSIGTATTDGSGDWSFDYTGTTLAEGTYALTAQATDLAANTGVLSGAFSVTIDTTAPAAPVITSISTDSGAADGTTNDATLVITGTAEANSSVEVFLDAGSIGTASTNGSGDWSFDYTGTTLAEGTYALTAQATDLAANTGVLSGAFSVIVDTTNPAAPVITSISTDSGAADGTTSDTTLVITGTAEANSSVEIFLDAGSIGTASTDGSGDWSFDYTGTTLAEGTYALTAQATDLAANTGVLSGAFSVTIDTTHPAAPVITSISSDSGAADGTTNDATLIITGTAEANSSVEIFLDAGSIGTASTDGSGDWSFDYTGTTLAEGTYALTAQATDLAANIGVLSGAFSVTIDTTAPAAPVISSISTDSGAADGTTSDTTLVITGNAEANSSVEIFLDAGSIGTATTDGSGDWSFDYTGTTLAEGTYALTAQATDLAANTGVLSGAFSVIVDTTNPAAPVITSISTDSGAADGTTSDTTLVITGTAEANSSVEIFLDAGSIGTASTDGSGDWSFDYTGTTLAEGTYALTAQATDLADNTSVLSGSFSVTIDTTAPAAPVISAISTDSGVADGTTNDATLVITGTAEANSSVEVFLDAGSIGTASSDGSGDWSFDYTGTTLAEGTYALTAQATDLAANTGVLSGAFSVTIDTTAPAAPVISSISTDSGAADGTTSDTTLVITGTAEANSSVEIFLDAGSIGTASTDGSGDWSFNYTGTTLAEGTYALTAQATDLATNTGVLSGAFSVTVDTTNPAAPVITSISTDSGAADGTTNDTTLVITGTAEADSSVEIFLDAGSIGTASTDGSGDWSFDYTGTTLAEGTYALTAQATDLADNTSVFSGAFSVTVDTTAPAAPVISSISIDSGAADGITSDTTLVITGTAEADSSVEIFLDAGSIGTATTDGSGDWSFDYTGTTLAEGTYALTAQATDLAANTGVLSGAFSVTIDTTNPGAPVITSISTDSGAADGITSDTTLVITGTAEADSSVEIFLDAGSIGTASTDGSGDWSFDYTGTTLAEGTYALNAQATDLAANTGVLSGAFSVTIDTTNPGAPVITSISTDTGAADGTTSDTTLVITGTAEADSSVEIFLDAGSIGTASTDGSGDWSFDYTGTTLAEGTYALTAQATDLAANTGVLSGAFSVTIDTTNPAAPVISSISTDSGLADGTTSDTTLVITGTAEADSSVEIFLDAGSIGTATTDGSGDWSFDYTGTTLAEGTYALTAQATDLAANTGVLSGAFSVTVDTTNPAAPVITSISTDSGAADGTTSDTTLVITGTAEADSSVEIFLDAGSIGTASTDGSGGWSFDYTGTTLAEGTYALTAQATDLAANTGVLSGAFLVTVDTTNPAAPVITSISTDSGAADGTTSDTTLVITGTAEADSSVEIFLDAGSIGTASTDGSGDWSFDYTGTTLAEGTYALTAQATDLAANSGVLSGAFSVTIDTTAPAPVITSISTDSGLADGTTNDATLIITGTAEANSSVEIFLDAGSIGTASTDGSGDWSFNYTGTTLAEGTYALTAEATDLAANTSVLSSAFSVTIDTTAPAAPVISSISTDSGVADGTTNDATLIITGTAEANSSVEIFLDAGSIGTASTDGSGDWSFDYTGTTLAEGTYALTAQARDLAANTGVLSGAFSVTVDTTNPVAPVITSISTDSGATDGTTNDTTLVITGTAEAGSSVEIFLDAGSIGTATTDGSGDWSFDYTGTTLAEGTYALTAQATDLAANTGFLSDAFSVTVDTTAPAAPVISSISTDSGTADGITSDTTLVITGTAEADSSVEIFLDAGSIGTASTDGSGDWSFDYTGTTLGEGSYVLTARATDSAGNSGALSGVFALTIDTTAPVITSGQSYTISEDAINLSSVGTVSGTDAIGTLNNWTIVAGNIDGIFTINAGTGEITVADNSNLDFESRTSYTLSIQVENGVNTSAIENITINVTDINDNAPIINSGQLFGLSGNADIGLAVGSVAAVDSDIIGTLQNWSIVSGNINGVFSINSATGLITVSDNTYLNQGANNYALGIQVEDGVNTSAIVNITINVSPVAETSPPPPVEVIEEIDDTAESTPVEEPAEETGVEEIAQEESTPPEVIEEKEEVAATEETSSIMQEEVVEEEVYRSWGFEKESTDGDTFDEGKTKVKINGSEIYVYRFTVQTDTTKYLQQKMTLGHNEVEFFNLETTDQLAAVDSDFINFDRSDERSKGMWNEFDTVRSEMDKTFEEESQNRQMVIKTVTGVSASLAVGSAAYVLRAGSLLSSFMASVPLWKGFDPIAVLSIKEKEKMLMKKKKSQRQAKGADGSDTDATEEMFQESRK